MRKGTYAILAELTLVVLIVSLSFLSVESSAATVWTDDFDDLNLDGWIVTLENFTAENGYLECTANISNPNFNYWPHIDHSSSVSFGTWSFDFLHTYLGWNIDFFVNESAPLYMGIIGYSNRIILYKGVTEVAQYDVETSGEWHHLDITLDESYAINVFLDGTHIIHYQSMDLLTGCEEFNYWSSGDGNAIDNIVVSNTIDVTCTDPTCEFCPEVTDTTTTTTTTTTETTPPPAPPLPMEMIVIAGGVVVVLVVLVIILKRK